MEEFLVKTKEFEGPLDLLLSLIEKRKLLINEISLGQVTEDYLHHTQRIGAYSIPERSEFIEIASALLLIKSRSLIPSLNLTSEEEQSVEDLELRLKILQLIREVSENIKEKFGKEIMFEREYVPKINPVFSPHQSITMNAIRLSIEDLINRIPKKIVEPKVSIKTTISIEEMIDKLTERIRKGITLSFKDFSGSNKIESREKKVEVIVGFLAMLEMVKQGVIDAMQNENFEDINMETFEISTPRYN